jgi:hypothetical protein
MAIIFTYPTKATPALADTIVITDSESEDPENSTKQTSIASIKALINDGGGGTVGGSGTINFIPMWSGTDTLTDSNISDNDSAVTINAKNGFTLNTDSSEKIVIGSSDLAFYSDTSATDNTTSFKRLTITPTGVTILGQTQAQGATSEIGGIIKYNNNTNNGYVGISGPITEGTSYQIRLPDTIGEVGQVLSIASIVAEGNFAVMQWVDNGSVVPSDPLAVDSMVTFDETVAGNGAAKITVSGGTPNYIVQVEETTTEQSFEINGSNNQTVFNFGTQAGGTSDSNLVAGTWQVLGGDSSTPQKLFKPLNKTFVIDTPPAPGPCDVTTVSTTTDTSSAGASDGEVSIAISNGTPDYKVFITLSGGTPQFSKDVSTEPVAFTGLRAGIWTITGQDGNDCNIPGSNGVATFTISDGSACNVTTSTVTTDADEGVANGQAVITINNGTANYNMTINHAVDGTSQTKENEASNVLTFTGLQAGAWSITGSDGDACPISSSFSIGSEARSCSLTITPTVTNESASGAEDGAVSIKVDDGIANYNAVITHSTGSSKSSTFTDSTMVFTGLKGGTWTLTGTDNEPSGTTKCSLAGYDGSSFTVGTTQTCNLTVSSGDIVQSNGAADNGSAILVFSGATGQVSGTVSSPDQTDVSFITTTVDGVPTATISGLGVGVWEIAGTDQATPACTLPSNNTFTIGNSGSSFLRLQVAGSGYATDETSVYSMIYKPGSPAGDGEGMRITVASSVGTGPVFSPGAEGENYEQGDILNATNGPGDPSGTPQVLAQYTYIL